MALNTVKNSLKINVFKKKLLQQISVVVVDFQSKRGIVTAKRVQTENNIIPRVFYGGRYTATLLPGAGIGPELTGYVKDVSN